MNVTESAITVIEYLPYCPRKLARLSPEGPAPTIRNWVCTSKLILVALFDGFKDPEK
jgi:hypothetical protein